MNTLLAHIRQLKAQDKLPDFGYGQALLTLSERDGITDEDLRAELFLTFLAGKQYVHLLMLFRLNCHTFSSPNAISLYDKCMHIPM